MSADIVRLPGTQPPPVRRKRGRQSPQDRFLNLKYGEVPSEEMIVAVWRWLNFFNKARLCGHLESLVEEQIRRT